MGIRALSEVVARFGLPHVDCFGVTEFRVWVRHGWHVHYGASASDPVGLGPTVERAALALLESLSRPGVVLVEGDYLGCDLCRD